MAQSLAKVCIHIIFSTKYRQPLIDDKIENDLHAYLGGICNELECLPIKVGGYVDHIHILCVLSRKIAIMDLLKEIKRGSSKWIKTQGREYEEFYWQDGYGIFSVNPTDLEVVIKYIGNQKAHHENKTFRTNTAVFSENIIWNMMSDMFGIDYFHRFIFIGLHVYSLYDDAIF